MFFGTEKNKQVFLWLPAHSSSGRTGFTAPVVSHVCLFHTIRLWNDQKCALTVCCDRYLGGNKFTSVPSFVPKLRTITYLDLQNNKITSLPPLTNLTNLKILSLMNNKITSIPDNFLAPTAPVQIYMHNNPLTHISDTICNTSMTLFTCYNCGINAIPECIGNASKLKDLLLRNNNITHIPDSLCDMESLRSIDFSNNNIKKIPECIGNATKLTTLNVWGNNITHLPDSICSLEALKVLRLRENNLKSVPSCIGSLNNLTTLVFGNNPSLNTLPDGMSSLTKLTHLNISFCNFSFLPRGLRGLQSLQSLIISDNSLHTLPDWIGEMSNLQVISASQNLLRTLPASIGNLGSLTSLYAANNQILAVPEDFTKATNLTLLSIAKNSVTQLPESLGSLTKLQYLFLNNNRLSYLPSSTKNIKHIQELVLTFNCLDKDKYSANLSSPANVYDEHQDSDCGGCNADRTQECADCAHDGTTCTACNTGYKLSAGRCVACDSSEFCPFGGTIPFSCGGCALCDTFASEPGHCFTCAKGKKSSTTDNSDCALDCLENEYCPNNRAATSIPRTCGVCKTCDNDMDPLTGTDEPFCLRCPAGFYGPYCTSACSARVWCPDGGRTETPPLCGNCMVCANDPHNSRLCKLCPEGQGYNDSGICVPCKNTIDEDSGLCVIESDDTIRIVCIVASAIASAFVVFGVIATVLLARRHRMRMQKLQESSSAQTLTSDNSYNKTLYSFDNGSSLSASNRDIDMSTLASSSSSTGTSFP